MIKDFDYYLNETERHMVRHLNSTWGENEHLRQMWLSRLTLARQAVALFSDEVRDYSRARLFVWLLEAAPFTPSERVAIHALLYDYLYA